MTSTELTTAKLEDGKEYYVRIDARDAAGNWVQAGPDTFTFDADHELEPAASFAVEVVELDSLEGFKDDNKDDIDDDGEVVIAAGDILYITLQALTDDDKTAFLYRSGGTLTVTNAQGLDLIEDKSPGATQPEDEENVIQLDANAWGSNGMRTVAFRDTVSEGRLVLSFQGEGVDAAFELSDTVSVKDNEYASLIVTGPSETVARGEDFTVEVGIADNFRERARKGQPLRKRHR